MTTSWRKWIALGTGLGIEIGAGQLQATIARLRPSGISVLGSATVPEFRHRPAAEWGSELLTFLRKLGCGHLAATVLLPRRDVIVRQVHLPGVSDRDLEAAIRLEIDSLHPFAEEDVAFSWARLGQSPHILVGITRRALMDSYASLFAEAGIKIASMTFSAGALYSSIRAQGQHPPANFLVMHSSEEGLEIYGESEARPVFSAAFDGSPVRAVAQARAELRLGEEIEPAALAQVLPEPKVFPADHDPATSGLERHALPYAAALVGACPWLALPANLLPADQRRASSRLRLVPTAVLASLLLILVGALAAHAHYEDGRYLALVQGEAAKLEPGARRVEAADRATLRARLQAQALDDFRRRSRHDLDVLNEITRLIAVPGWVSGMELTGQALNLTGEVDQAAALLKSFDESKLFEGTEFVMPPSRGAQGETFRIRTRRQEGAR